MNPRAFLADIVVPLALLTPATAFVLTLPILGPGAIVAAVVALVAALVVAAPLLAWWLARGRTRWFEVTGLGLVAGALPFSAWGLVVGAVDGSFTPSFAFVVFVLLSAAIGAATGAEYWLLFLRHPRGDD